MATSLASIYDILYSWKDYPAEARDLRLLIERHAPGAKRLLDVGCGTGKHMLELQNLSYQVSGVDLDPGMVKIAGERLGEGVVHVGDMRTFSLPARFDVVTCMFSAIGYVKTVEGLHSAVANMARHLAGPGSVLAVEAWFLRGAFKPGVMHASLSDQQVKVVRMGTSRVEGDVSVLEMHYLVGRDGTIDHWSDLHHLGLWTDADYRAAFEAAGLTVVEVQLEGFTKRGVYVGVMK